MGRQTTVLALSLGLVTAAGSGNAQQAARVSSAQPLRSTLSTRDSDAGRQVRHLLQTVTVQSAGPDRVPRLVRARPGAAPTLETARQTPEAAARFHLERLSPLYGVPSTVIGLLSLQHVLDTGRGGILVSFQSQADGIEILSHSVKVLLTRERELMAISGHPHPSARRGNRPTRLLPRIDPEQALASAFLKLYAVPSSPTEFLELPPRGTDWRDFDLEPGAEAQSLGLDFMEPARVRPVLLSDGVSLRPAWALELFSGFQDEVSSDAFSLLVDGLSGEVLSVHSLTDDVAFTYRVWSEGGSAAVPTAGPMADVLPHPTGSPDGVLPAYISSVLVTMDGFNTNPSGTQDPWLPADATVTTGNNVDAYADFYEPDGYSLGDVRPTTTARRVFDRTYDVTQEPTASSGQTMAAVTQLFYVTNWLHDYYYDSGFDESAGNAQLSNFGRGGIEGDPLRAEGQDSAPYYVRNNANMTTPADGVSPHMQMYLWTPASQSHVIVPTYSPDALEAGPASFGPLDFNLTANLVLANDGTSTVTDACEPLRGVVSRRIVLADRGNCTFQVKALNAEEAGASGLLVANNVEGGVITMAVSDPYAPVEIPLLMISLEHGSGIKSKMAGQTVAATLFRESDVERDGTIDNAVIAHEWGHYLHRRLVTCSTLQCRALSEGWADFLSLHLLQEEGDALDGVYGLAVYAGASSPDAGYYGLRRAPYSTRFDINPLTFKHIQQSEPLPDLETFLDAGDPSEVHSAGEVWAQQLWEGYAAMLAGAQETPPRASWAELRRRMADIIVAGLMLSPDETTYTEQRDAILAVAAAGSPEDHLTLAQGFARRGNGTCAVSPPRDSADLNGVVESFELAPALEVLSIELSEDYSCDGDGYADASEQAQVRVMISNSGGSALSVGTVELLNEAGDLEVLGSSVQPIGSLAPLQAVPVEFSILLDADLAEVQPLILRAVAAGEGACGEAGLEQTFRVNLDAVPQSSASETFESDASTWTAEDRGELTGVWSRGETSVLEHQARGADLSGISDSSLESPLLVVGTSEPLVLRFSHRFRFEASVGDDGETLTYWDGAVLEVREQGGDWIDIGALADPGYGGIISDLAGNPLAARSAFVDKNPSYPDSDIVNLDLGSTLAGKTIQLRFRIGTDQALGDEGWTIDDVSVSGLSNLPFTAIVADQSEPGIRYPDADSDGFGQAGAAGVAMCGQIPGTSSTSDDCNDQDLAIFPGAPEACDGVDQDCDGQIDDAPTYGILIFEDADGDGVGNSEAAQIACEVPAGTSDLGGDCDDTDPGISPLEAEICDGRDNDCDGLEDNDPVDASLFYPDRDGDGFGSSSASVEACEGPEGTVSVPGDCDDAAPDVYPGATEPADGIDHNCDGQSTEPGQPTPTPTPSLETPTPGGDTPTPEASSPTPGSQTPTPATAPDPTGTPTPEPEGDSGGCGCAQPGSTRPPVPLAWLLVPLLFLSQRRTPSTRALRR